VLEGCDFELSGLVRTLCEPCQLLEGGRNLLWSRAQSKFLTAKAIRNDKGSGSDDRSSPERGFGSVGRRFLLFPVVGHAFELELLTQCFGHCSQVVSESAPPPPH
jgi:hypothetical protein